VVPKALRGEQRVNKREALKRKLLEERGYLCEVLPYLPHECQGAQDMHEVIYNRNDVRGLEPAKRDYIVDTRNCVLVCHEHHVAEGRTEAYTRACVQALVDRHGLDEMRTYVFLAPFKTATLASRLVFWMADGGDDAYG
jgi:hypothetical protein